MPRKPENLQLHNLCEDQSLVTDELLETLGLGLGHNVALKQKDENPIDFDRLRYSIRLQFAEFDRVDDDNDFNPKLHVKSDWIPDPAPTTIENAINDFEEKTNTSFAAARKIKLLPIYDVKRSSIDLIRSIKKNRKLVITASDKGLGPTIMETSTYINRAFDDHLNNPINYKEIIEEDAHLINETNFRWICERFIDYRDPDTVTDKEKLFFQRSLCGATADDLITEMQTQLGLPYFYLLPKVHKTPWATRPVVSGVSSVLEPLSKWVDIQLQRVIHLCPAYLKDSWHFLNEMKNLDILDEYRIVTSDAKAMYVNINTDHAIETIRLWFALHAAELPTNFPTELILESIGRLMKFNVFTFGNRFFIQTNGTAMGTNAACMYATIYYSYHEETVLSKLPFVKFYRRLIDDAFIIIDNGAGNFEELQRSMDNFGPVGKRLEWVATKPSRSVDFLDLTVSITDTGDIMTKTFQKAMNLYLYRCPSSAQPESILESLIYGTLHRYYWQNTNITDFGRFAELFFERLAARAHKKCDLAPLFIKAAKIVQDSSLPNPRPGDTKSHSKNDRLLFIHLPYHPQHPSRESTRYHCNTLLEQLNDEKDCFERIVLAFSRAPNIGDLCKKNHLEFAIDTSTTK